MHELQLQVHATSLNENKKPKEKKDEYYGDDEYCIDAFTTKLTLFGSLFFWTSQNDDDDRSKWKNETDKKNRRKRNDWLIDGSLQSSIGNINIHHFMI